MTIEPAKLLTGIPVGLRRPLIEHYSRIARNFVERRWEPAELNAGKLCEVAYSIVAGALSGKFPAKPRKPRDMVAACRSLEQQQASAGRPGDRSLRVLLPRVIVSLYEVRNNRGVGHVAGDVDSNEMDATMVFSASNWMLCELVRVFHSVPVEVAQRSVTALCERRLPEIWQVGDKKRILSTSLKARDQTLLFLYSEADWTAVARLCQWIEYTNASQYRRKILRLLHKERLVEFDSEVDRVQISPKGAMRVEEKILPLLS